MLCLLGRKKGGSAVEEEMGLLWVAAAAVLGSEVNSVAKYCPLWNGGEGIGFVG